MELRQLKYFIRLAETLNFSTAAKDLFITQSTLSQQILNLERELNQQLFQRNSHEVLLTEAGQMLLPMARECIYGIDTMLLRIQELKQLLIGELNIGVTFSFSNMIAETMIDFMKAYPKVKLNVLYSSMADLMEKLIKHELDFVLAFKPNEQNEHIKSQTLFNNRLSAIVNENHPLALKNNLILEDLKKYSFILPTIGMQARNVFENVMKEAPFKYHVKTEINNVSLLLKLIRQTNYVTFLSSSTVIGESGLKAIPINMASAQMEGCIHTLRDAYQKVSAQEFIRMLNVSISMFQNTQLTSYI